MSTLARSVRVDVKLKYSLFLFVFFLLLSVGRFSMAVNPSTIIGTAQLGCDGVLIPCTPLNVDVNLDSTINCPTCGVAIYQTTVTGKIFNFQLGGTAPIDLGTAPGGPLQHDGAGKIYGQIWTINGGLLSFGTSPANSTLSFTPSGSDAQLSGTAWSTVKGLVSFNCAADPTFPPTSCLNGATVTTNWKMPSGGGGGGCSSVAGECGSAGAPLASFAEAPATNLCSDSSIPAVSPSDGNWTWTCLGSCNGESASCSAIKEAAPFDFSIIPAQDSVSVSQGDSAIIGINVNLVSGTAENVILSVSTTEPTITFLFSPTSCTPTCSPSPQLTIQTTDQTSEADYTITVTGSGGSITKTSNFILHVSILPLFEVTIIQKVPPETTLPEGEGELPPEEELSAPTGLEVIGGGEGEVGGVGGEGGENIPPEEELLTPTGLEVADGEGDGGETTTTNPLLTTEIIQNISDFVGGILGKQASAGVASLLNGVSDGLLTISDFFQNNIVKNILNIITPLGVATGALTGAIAALFLNPMAIKDMLLLPVRTWGSLLTFLGIKKRAHIWGVVYDSVTKQPLDPAVVLLLDQKGNDVTDAITDLDGRYGFLVGPGIYTLAANKTDYKYPSDKLKGRHFDELYQDLYFGEQIEVKESGGVIAKNIPLDPLKFNWNEFAKNEQKLMKFYSRRDLWFARVSNAFYIIGFIVAIIAMVSVPRPFNFIIVGLYLLIYLLRRTHVLKPKPHGVLIDKQTKLPIPFAIIRVFSAVTNTQIIQKVTNKIGKYLILVPNGNYYVKVDKKNLDESYTTIHQSEVFEVKKGAINKVIKL